MNKRIALLIVIFVGLSLYSQALAAEFLQSERDSGKAAQLTVFLDQPPSTENTDAYTDQDYDQHTNYMDTFIADDFEVPAGQVWRIDEIDLYGDGWHGLDSLDEADSLNCYLFEDTVLAPHRPRGVPGGLGGSGIWNESWPPNDGHVTIVDDYDFQFAPETPPIIGAGKYWVSCYPVLNYIDYGAWGVHVSDAAFGYKAKIINPLGGTGWLPTSWDDLDNYFDMDQTEMAFQISGTVVWPTTSTTTTVPTTTSTTTTTIGPDDDTDDDVVDDAADDTDDDSGDDAADDVVDDASDDSADIGDDSGGTDDDTSALAGQESGHGTGGCGC